MTQREAMVILANELEYVWLDEYDKDSEAYDQLKKALEFIRSVLA